MLEDLRVSQCSPNDEDYVVEFTVLGVAFQTKDTLTHSDAMKVVKGMGTWWREHTYAAVRDRVLTQMKNDVDAALSCAISWYIKTIDLKRYLDTMWNATRMFYPRTVNVQFVLG